MTTLNVGWFIVPGMTETHHWILKDCYDLSESGKYALYFEVRDQKTNQVLRSKTVAFSIPGAVK